MFSRSFGKQLANTVVSTSTITALKDIVSSFLALFDPKDNTLPLAKTSTLAAGDLGTNKLVSMYRKPASQINWEDAFQSRCAVESIPGIAKDNETRATLLKTLDQALNENEKVNILPEKNQKQIKTHLQAFMDEYAAQNLHQYRLAAIDNLTSFSMTSDPGDADIKTLNKLRHDIQIACEALQNTANLGKANSLVREFNEKIHPHTYNIKAVTYNLGNQNPPKTAVEELGTSICPALTDAKDAPDIIVFSLQEAKKSWSGKGWTSWLTGGQNLAERIIKRYNAREQLKDLYEIIHADDMPAITHLGQDLKNWTNWSRTQLVIAYKKTSFPRGSDDIKIEAEGRHTAWSVLNPLDNFDNKGGLYAVLNIRGTRIGVIGVHLDSFDPNKRYQQAVKLRAACQANHPLDSLIFMGDLNERLHPKALATKNRNRALTVQDLQDENGTLTTVLTQSQKHSTAANTHLADIDFLEPDGPTYPKTNDNINLHPKRDRLDIGILDNIGIQNFNSPLAQLQHALPDKKTTPIRPKDENRNEVSDHAAVIGKFTLKISLNAEQELDFDLILEEIDQAKSKDQLKKLHDSLFQQDHHNFLPLYVDHAIAATASAANTPVPYHLSDIELIKQDMTFIINHLHLLPRGMPYNELIRLTFGTCEKIEDLQKNTGSYLHQIYEQLLNEKNPLLNEIRIKLLRPFRLWLEQHRISHTTYKHSTNEKTGIVTIHRHAAANSTKETTPPPPSPSDHTSAASEGDATAPSPDAFGKHNTASSKSDLNNSNTIFNNNSNSKSLKKPSYPEGLIFQTVIGDGHCFYNAVGKHLKKTATQLRNDVANYLNQNRDQYADVLPPNVIEAHIQGIINGAWGDDLELNILMRLLETPILVVRPEGTISHPDIAITYPNSDPIFIYYNGRDHYDTFTINEGFTGRGIYNQWAQARTSSPGNN